MYAEIRKYHTKNKEEITSKVRAEFLPMLRTHAGFVAYYVLDEEGDVMASVTIFETQAEARESNELAAEWVQHSIVHLVAGPPEIVEGHIVVNS
jgi:surfactin synthase thioesterase subunit